MDVSIGLPNTVPGTTGEQLVEWARRAEGHGASSATARAAQAKAAWAAAGRDGEPRLMRLAYFPLGDGAEEKANAYLTDYAWLGEEVAGYIAGSIPAETAKGYLAAFEGVGCDELILCPSSSDPAQVDLLADAAGIEPGPLLDASRG